MNRHIFVDEVVYRDLEMLGRLGHPSRTADQMAVLILRTFTETVIHEADVDITHRLERMLSQQQQTE